MKRFGKNVGFGVLFLILLIVGLYSSGAFNDFLFVKAMKRCNIVSEEERFSCFRAGLENYPMSNLEEHIAHVELLVPKFTTNSEDTSYAIFGTNCHTFYHALGDFVAMHAEGRSVEELIKIGTMRCTAGYAMGFFKRLAYEHDYHDQYISNILEACPSPAWNSCVHEVGHVLHDKYTQPILALLDPITEKQYGVQVVPPATDRSSYALDLTRPFEDCRALVPEDDWPYCYTGIGHNMFLFGAFNPKGYLAELDRCVGVSDVENQEECNEFLIYRIGVNYAAPLFLSSSFDEGKTICQNAVARASTPNEQEYFEQCYLGVGGGIGLYIDSELLSIDPASGDIPRLKEDLARYARLCNRMPEGYQDNCTLGLLGTNYLKAYLKYRMFDPTIERLIPYAGNYEIVG